MTSSKWYGFAAGALALALGSADVRAQALPHGSLNRSSMGSSLTDGRQPPGVGAGGCASGVCLAVTLALDDPGNPALCGTATNLPVVLGDAVNICYVVTNMTGVALNYQTLTDDHAGALLTNTAVTIAPGASYQYNRRITASTNPNGTTGTFTSTWSATASLAGYAANDQVPYAFVDIRSTGTALNLADDGATAVPLPFAFPFYTTSAANLCIGNNGGISFGVASCSGFTYNNRALPTTSLNTPLILPYWDDFMADGTVYHGTVGTTPNRRFVVAWHDKPNYGDNGIATGQVPATFEVILNEADGSIDFQYQSTAFGGPAAAYDNGASATVGLQGDPSTANQYSYNAASLHAGQAIHWTPQIPPSYTGTAVATLDVGAPSVLTSPASADGFTLSVPAASSATRPLLVDNIGNRDLAWSLTPPAPNAHFATARKSAAMRAANAPFLSPAWLRAASVTKLPVPFGSGAIPAFASKLTNTGGADYVTFDVNDPATFNTLASNTVVLFGGDFVDNDFSKEYGVDFQHADLYSVSTIDGSSTLIGHTGLPTSGFVFPGGMSWDATTGTTYFVMDDFQNMTSTLYTIDLATGAPTFIGPLTGALVRDIAIDRSGLMYGIDSATDMLLAIDKTSGATQEIGSLGIDAVFSQSMDFDDETGVLYLASMGSNVAAMYTVDTATGATMPVGQLAGEINGFAIAKSGVRCSTANDAPWLSYDVASGVVLPDPDQTHPAAVTLSFDASHLAPGSYDATLCVYTNDPTKGRVPLPIALTVTPAADTIFRNGFEIATF